MALETNARIPSPYVYQPVDFGGKIDAEAANKAAALKAGVQAKKDLKTKNDAALAVKPTWTTEGVLNGAIENKANQIRDTYSKMAAAGVPIWDATTPEGSAFAEEIAGLNKFSSEMKGYEQNINEIEAIKGADNDAYNYYVGKIGEAKVPEDVAKVVVDYRENKDLLAKAPDLSKAVASTVNDAAKDKDIVDVGKLGKFDKVTIKSSIDDDKIQDIFEVAKNSESSQLEEKLYNFKQENGIRDPKFDQFNSYDEYLMDQVKDQIALTASTNDQLKSQWQINISNRTGGSTPTTPTGNAVNYTTGNNQVQAGGFGFGDYVNKNGKHLVSINVDDSVLTNAKLPAGAITEENGKRYIDVDYMYKFEDAADKAAIQDINWVWTAKQNAKGDPNWTPQAGNYKTTTGATVSGYPITLLWDQAGNGWGGIKDGSGNVVYVMVYPTDESYYGGSGSQVQNNAKRNATELLTTFADNGLVDKNAAANPFVGIYNNFNKTSGYQGKVVK
jgi:hypothetical protein